jgi:hypothetical protein
MSLKPEVNLIQEMIRWLILMLVTPIAQVCMPYWSGRLLVSVEGLVGTLGSWHHRLPTCVFMLDGEI